MDNQELFSDRAIAYSLLRLTLGTTMLVNGLSTIIGGPGHFAVGLVKDFAHTFLPAVLVYVFGAILPFLEATIGILLTLGLLTKLALVTGALAMVALVVGMTLRQQFAIVGMQLVYALIYFVLLHQLRHNQLSVDRLRLRFFTERTVKPGS